MAQNQTQAAVSEIDKDNRTLAGANAAQGTTGNQWTQGEVGQINSANETLAGLLKPPTQQQSEPTTNGAQGIVGLADPTSLGAAKALSGTPVTQSIPKTLSQNVDSYLDPYVKEMMNLGPEYQSEMDFLKPYLTGTGSSTPETFDQLTSASKADESSTGSKAVNAADAQAGNALENQPAPGFGQLASAAKDYEGTLPYSDILQTVLGAGKNEILYGVNPNISSISTKEWPASLQQAYGYLTEAATGTNAQSGLNAPSVAAGQTAPTGSGTGASTTPDGVFTPSSTAGGNN